MRDGKSIGPFVDLGDSCEISIGTLEFTTSARIGSIIGINVSVVFGHTWAKMVVVPELPIADPAPNRNNF